MYKIKIPEIDEVFEGWTIGDEKEYLLNKDNDNIDEIFSYLCKSKNEYTEEEKTFILLHMRNHLYGDEVEVKYTCPHCNNASEGVYSINEAIEYKRMNNVFYIDNKDVIINIKNTLEDSINRDIEFLDSLSIKEYNYLNLAFESLKNNKLKFKPKVRCFLCQKQTVTSLDDKEIKDLIINRTLKDYYQTELFLKKKGNFSIHEIKNMYPFEVTLYVDMLQDKGE